MPDFTPVKAIIFSGWRFLSLLRSASVRSGAATMAA
jgi:hypothetical protein